jgi:hypothetical protein
MDASRNSREISANHVKLANCYADPGAREKMIAELNLGYNPPCYNVCQPYSRRVPMAFLR